MNSIKRFQDFLGAFRIYKQASTYRWDPEALEHHRRARLASLVKHAKQNSPFYKDLYRDIDEDGEFSVTDLPAVDKATMMTNYDDVVTDSRLKLDDLRAHMERIRGDDYYLGEYRVFTTGGSTGLRGVFVFNRREWQTALSTGMRSGPYFGIRGPRFPKRWRFACIVAESPLHVSGAYTRGIDYNFHNMLILPTSTPLNELAAALNHFKPECLSGFSSLIELLALEDLDGNLNISPDIVLTLAETMTEDMKKNIRNSWGVEPFNMYGLTEAGVNTSIDCSRHCGKHIYDDLFIIEAVNEDNKPVPAGEKGARVLFTNLYNYTQPVIRYEVSDVITLSSEPCPCGDPFTLISDIEGRADEVLYLPGKDSGRVPVHPHNLRSPLAGITNVRQYQIIQEPDGLHITTALRRGADADEARDEIKQKINGKLTSIGVQCPELHIHVVDYINRNQDGVGKFRLIKSSLPDRKAS